MASYIFPRLSNLVTNGRILFDEHPNDNTVNHIRKTLCRRVGNPMGGDQTSTSRRFPGKATRSMKNVRHYGGILNYFFRFWYDIPQYLIIRRFNIEPFSRFREILSISIFIFLGIKLQL